MPVVSFLQSSLTQERQYVLRDRVRLREYRHTRLLQDLRTRERRGLLRKVRILDPRARGRLVLCGDPQVRHRLLEAIDRRTELRP